MEESVSRHHVDGAPRSATSREWEAFVREEPSSALEHVGSVTAPDAGDAHDRVTELFGPDAADVWVCPTEAVTRFVADGVGKPTDPAADEGGDDGREAAPRLEDSRLTERRPAGGAEGGR